MTNKDKIKYYQKSQIVKDYEKTRFGTKSSHFLGEKELSFFIKNIKKINPQKILDAPCGTGRLLAKLNILDQNFQLYGLDTSNKMLKYCQSRILECKLKKSTLQKMPYKNSFFDCIISLRIFHHYPIKTVKKMLRESIRVLKKDAFIMFDTHNTSPKIIINLFFPSSIHRVYLHPDKQIEKLSKNLNLRVVKRQKMFLFTPRMLKLMPLDLVKFIEKVGKKLPGFFLSRTYWLLQKK